MRLPQDSQLVKACRTLFGQDVVCSRHFLAALQPNGAKLAFRNQVKVHHPDRFGSAPQHIRQRQTERFQEIHQAYDLLKCFLEQRQTPGRTAASSPSRSPRRRHDYSVVRQPRGSASGQQPRIPDIELQFGMYVYYSGKISYQDLIQGLLWQRRQRPALGSIARQWGWLTEAQVSSILMHHGHSMRFGKKAIELRLLKAQQVEALLACQKSQQQPLGHFFVVRGLLSQRETETLARQLERHNSRLQSRKRSQSFLTTDSV